MSGLGAILVIPGFLLTGIGIIILLSSIKNKGIRKYGITLLLAGGILLLVGNQLCTYKY